MSFSLVHLVRKPRTASSDGKPPVLILLHGVGSNEHDLMGLAPQIDGRFLIVSARAPITLQAGSYAWFHVQFVPNGFLVDPEEAEESRKKVVAFVDEVVAQYDVDPARVFLGGFSQGCIMSLYSSLTEPEKFTGGVVGMSGRLLPEAVPNTAAAERLKNLRITVVHGTEDPVIPIRFGREIRDHLSKLPLKKFEYKEYPMGHYVSPESMSDISNWLTDRLDHQQ
jgi:phospholipase/carboxylesterase